MKILETFQSHQSVRYIKEATYDTKFSFKHVLLWEIHQTTMELIKNKAAVEIFLLKRDICAPLTDCINSAILSGVFTDELKLASVTPLYKKTDSQDKTNY